MYEQPRWPREAVVPILAGLIWLWYAASFGLIGFLFSLIPGVLLMGSGVSLLLWPGDDRITQFSALGGLLGVPLALPAFWVSGFGIGLVLVTFSAASFVAAGIGAIRQEPHVDGVPSPPIDLRTAAQVAVDEVLLSTMNLSRSAPFGQDLARVRQEVAEGHDFFEAQGWVEKPLDYHRTPPPLEHVETKRGRTIGIDYEEIRFESGYEPLEGEPGRQRWLGFAPNRDGYARILRARGADRPWVLGIHGYQMGWPFTDVGMFRRLWQKHDVNVLLPVLPLHGPRKVGRRSGDGYLEGDLLNSVHAEAQAMWDMRRVLGWAREQQGAEKIGAFGLSLGGYNAGLLSALAPELRCVIAGIPAVDFSRLMWRHGPPLDVLTVEQGGMFREEVADLLRVVSPLELEPLVPKAHRAIFAGTADRLIPPDQVMDLWEHWDQPTLHWYHGGHMTFGLDPAVDRLIVDTLRGAELV